MRLVDVKREQMIDGMEAIIRRICRLGYRGDLILMADEYSPREVAIKLLAFVEGKDSEIGGDRQEGGMSDELERLRSENKRLRGTLKYIHTQAKTRPSGDALTLSVIERNAAAALDDRFQDVYRAALGSLNLKSTS